jgi:YVTN family beta-propeller protein
MPGESSAQYLEATIPTGLAPRAVMWNPTANKVYTADDDGGTVTIIDGASNEVRATVPVGVYPGGLSCNPHTNKVYVCRAGEEPGDYVLAVIDGAGDSVLTRLQLQNRPCWSVVNENLNKVYVYCNEPLERITVLDGTADTVLRELRTRFSSYMLVHPASNRLFFYTDGDFDTVKVLDCSTDSVVVRMPMQTDRRSMGGWCYNPANDFAYLSTGRGTYAFPATGDSVVALVSGGAAELCAVPFPNKLYLKTDWDWLWVVDGNTNSVTDTLAIQGGPILCDTVHGKVYTSRASTHLVSVVDARSDTLLKTIPLPGTMPYEMCWNRSNSRVYIADPQANAVQVVRDTTTGVSESHPYRVASGARAGSLVSGAFKWPGREAGRVIDASGKGVAEVNHGSNDLGHLPAGVYVVVGAGTDATTKFVKLR